MLHENTLDEIKESRLKCVEYEIGMFLCLLTKEDERNAVIDAIHSRNDYNKILEIANSANKEFILNILSYAGMSFDDVSFESQNDDVGPADIVIYATNRHHEKKKIGISIEYNNDVIYNYSGSNLLADEQITYLKGRLPEFAKRFLDEMIAKFGSFNEWYRIRFDTSQRIASLVTNEYIDIVRDAVVERWNTMIQEDKDAFLYKVYRTDSPLDYWIYSFQKRGKFILCTNPPYIRRSAYSKVTIRKIAGQYIGFYLDEKILGRTQVKFNNGILEKYTSKRYDDALKDNNFQLANTILERYVEQGKGMIVEGVPLKIGTPFTSWNYEISY